MQRLKELRLERGWSQARLAGRAELDPSTVNQIERGVREASPGTLRKLAEALEVSLYDLLEDDFPKDQAPLPFDAENGKSGASFKGSVTIWIRHLEESVDYFAGQLDRRDLGLDGISKISTLTIGLMELCHVFEGDVYAEADPELLAQYEKAARLLVFGLDDMVIERYDREVRAAKEAQNAPAASIEEWKRNRQSRQEVAEPVRDRLQRSA